MLSLGPAQSLVTGYATMQNRSLKLLLKEGVLLYTLSLAFHFSVIVPVPEPC